MKKFALCASALALALSAATASAEGDPEAGAEKAARCGSCHGSDGIGIAEAFPNLAAQKEGYLVKQMKDFKTGKRNDPIMANEVANLSEQDIKDIAAFYAGLSGEETPRAHLH